MTAVYAAVKRRESARRRELTLLGQDIGPIPAVADPRRRARAEASLEFFLKTYFPQVFHLAWSGDHLEAIGLIEGAARDGGLFAYAMPRGSGKTSMCEGAVLWSQLVGLHPFVMLVGATADAAGVALAKIKSQLQNNDLLLADWPEVVFPFRKLEGESRRASGQRYYGKLTHIGWSAEEVVFPMIPGSRAGGSVIRTAGLTGNIRGASHVTPAGASVRPSLVIIDDAQTDQSARSVSQVKERLAIIEGTILNLAGPGQKIAAVMPCTVIRADDVADQLLDRARHPEWQGRRTKLMKSLPTNDAMWNEYTRLRAESLRNGGKGEPATEYYRENREAMDEGAEASWPERHNSDEISAVQYAMNLRMRNEAAFWAEYQNEPLSERGGDGVELTIEGLELKVTGLKRGEVPLGVEHLVSFVDVQKDVLFWTAMGFADDFTGWILDYGAWPDQKRDYFTLSNITRTLAGFTKAATMEGQIYNGLRGACDLLFGRGSGGQARPWRRQDGVGMEMERCMVDANWGRSTDVVYQFCREGGGADGMYRGKVTPSHGRYFGASAVPISEYKRKEGERVGTYWRMGQPKAARGVRHALWDTNWWKSFTEQRLLQAQGDAGSYSIFGVEANGRRTDHRMLFEHLTSEGKTKVTARGREIDEWRIKVGRDNHFWDCVVGCSVAASIAGAKVLGSSTPAVVRRVVKLSERKGKVWGGQK
jgi:hypothetical protein